MTIEQEIIQKMEKLSQLLERWNYEYFVLNRPTVDDKIYDQILQELKSLEEKYDFVLPRSPTQKIGIKSEKKKFRLVKHQIPMLSLNSTDNCEELIKFDQRIKKKLELNDLQYLCELKIDGLSASLIYQKGKLIMIVTRGDGWIGEEVSINQHLIEDIPPVLPQNIDCEVRGEVYMEKAEFLRLNEDLKKKNIKILANPRNAAAGTLRTLFPTQSRKLRFFAYQIFGIKIINQQECLKKLSQLGFPVSPHYRFCQDLKEIQNYFQEVKKNRDKLDFDIDGIVIKVNNYDHHEKLGKTNKFPHWALAYKFPASIATSEIKDIQAEITRSGRISYVGQIEPVLLKGSKISKATLHNYGFIRELNLNIGDKIVLKKAGDIIPQITQVIKMDKKNDCWIPPNNCPSCGYSLEWNQEKIYQNCSNEECPERNIKSLILFASKPAMDIKGINEAIIRKLHQANLLRTSADFYRLGQKKAEVLKMEGFQRKSVNNLLSNIELSKKKPFFHLVTALGIPLIGGVKSRKLTSIYSDPGHFIEAVEKNELKTIGENLGKETQKEVENFFQKPKNLNIFKELIKFFH